MQNVCQLRNISTGFVSESPLTDHVKKKNDQLTENDLLQEIPTVL